MEMSVGVLVRVGATVQGCCPGPLQPQTALAPVQMLSLWEAQQIPLLRWKSEWVRHPGGPYLPCVCRSLF